MNILKKKKRREHNERKGGKIVNIIENMETNREGRLLI